MSPQLRSAVKLGDVESVRTILDCGESPNSVDSTGWSCLMLSIENMHASMLTFLLEHGANPTYATSAGWTALHHAVDIECDAELQTGRPATGELVRILIAAGADPLAGGDKTPLKLARRYQNAVVVAALPSHS